MSERNSQAWKSRAPKAPKPPGTGQKGGTGASIESRRVQSLRVQKAFRARKEAHLNELQEKCKRLEGVIEGMTTTVLEFSDGLVSSENLGQSTAECLKVTLDQLLALSRKAAENPTVMLSEPHSITGYSSTDNMPANSDRSQNDVVVPKLRASPNRALNPSATEGNDTIQSAAILSYEPTPNIQSNYSLWSESVQPRGEDGSSAIPYILSGRDSFASRLYFETIALALRSLHGELPRSLANSIFRFKMQHLNVDKIKAVLESILNMLLYGTCSFSDESRQITEDDEDKIVKTSIVQQIERSGSSEHEYLSTWDVEQYLKKKWRLAIDSGTVRVQNTALLSLKDDGKFRFTTVDDSNPKMIFPTLVPGFSDQSPSAWNAEALVERLKSVAVSIGEGPRWHLTDIDEAVEDFLIENRAN